MTTSVATLSGERVEIEAAAVERLRAAFRGAVIRPGEPGYADKPIFNAMHQRRPALVARCAGTTDVVEAMKFARDHDLLVAVRGGGHSIAGHSSCDGGMVIDLTQMRGVHVDSAARVARVQGWSALGRR